MQECNRREKALVAGNGCMHSPTNMPSFWLTLLLPGPAGRLPQTCTPNYRPFQRQSVPSGAAHSYGTLKEIEKERTIAKRNRNTERADVHLKEIRKGHHYSLPSARAHHCLTNSCFFHFSSLHEMISIKFADYPILVRLRIVKYCQGLLVQAVLPNER